MIFIFFPGIKNFISSNKNDSVGLDFGGFESFAYSFVKPPNASSVIRGRGVIDGRSAVSEDRTFTLSFTCSEEHLYDLIFFYHLSGIFGLIPMKNSEIFDKVFTPYGEYLKTDIHSNIFDSLDPEFLIVGKSVSDSINRSIKSSDNNFFVFLKRMSVKTIPGTTLTFVVELELIPYFNSLNLVLRQNSFFAEYKKNFAQKSEAIKSLYNYIKSKPIKVDSSLSLIPVLKSHMSAGTTNSKNLAAAVLPSVSIDSKFITSLEVVLYNNIVSLPLQSYSPSFQHLGKGEVGITIGLDFARDFGNNSDSFSTISKQFNLVSRMNHKTHYLSVNHWLFDCFDLTNFYMQGCTILDKESDTSQQSAISAFFLANSYTHDELLFNAYKARVSDYTVESQIKDSINTFRFFLKEYKSSSKKNDFFGANILSAFSDKNIHSLFPDAESVYKLINGESKNIPSQTSTCLILCMLANSDSGRGKILTAITMSQKNSKSVYNLIGSYFFAEIFFFLSSGIVFSDTRDIEFRKFCIYYLYQNFFGVFFKQAVINNIVFSNAFDTSWLSVSESLVSQLKTDFTNKKELFNFSSTSLDEYVSSAEVIIRSELNRLTSSKNSLLSYVNPDIKSLFVNESNFPNSFMFFFCTDFFAESLLPYGESIQGFEAPIMASSSEFFTLASHYLSNPTVYQEISKKDTSKFLPPQDSFGRNLTGSSDYNIPNFDYDVYFDGNSFWGAAGHPSDLIKSSLGKFSLSEISDDIYHLFEKTKIESGSLKGVLSKLTEDEQSKLSMIDKIFYDAGVLSKTSSEQIKSRLNKCSALFSSQLYDFMPIIYLEFCNRTVATNSQSMDQYHTLNTYGYANKIVETAVTTDPNTRIKTCKITLLDVEFIKKTVINNKTYVLNEGSALDTRFEYSPQNFPIGIGSRICLSIGSSKKDLNTIFTGTVESVSVDTEKNYLILDCASFAKTVYSGDYNVSLGPGGRGIVENVFSWDNLSNSFEHLKNKFKYNDTYYKNLQKLHMNSVALRGNLNKDCIPISEYSLDYFMSTDFQITSYYILASHLSQAARTYLQSLNEINNTGSLSFINNAEKLTYGGFAYTKKNTPNGGILKNINNVDFDFSFYGTRKRVSATDKKLYYNTSPYCDVLFPVSGDKPSRKDASKSELSTNPLVEVRSLSSISLKINSVDEVIEATNVLGPKVYYKDESGADGVSQTYRKKSATIADLLNDMENRYSGALWDVLDDGRGATLFFGRNNYFINRVKSPYSFGLEKLNVIQNTKIVVKDSMNVSEVIKTYSNVQSDSKAKLNVTEPYRNQFVAISGVNLISCHIASNMNIANTAVVNYDYSLASQFLVNFDNLLKKVFTTEELGKVTIPSLSNIPEELQIPIQNTKESEENINSESQAYEYGLSMLEKEYAKFYSGKIVLTYSPEVRVGTELFISDAYNKIFGSVICSNVSHYCSAEEGFITVVTPALKVDNNSPNESLTLNLKGIKVGEGISGKGAKFPDYHKISTCVVANNFPITTSPGVISYEVTKKDSNYQFNNSLKYPSDQGLALGCTFYPIQHNAKILSPYSEELKVYSIGAAHSATVLKNAGTYLSEKAYNFQSWFTGIKNWLGEVSSSFTNLFFEKSPGFSLLDLMKTEDLPTYDSPVIINDVQNTTFFISISKNFIFDIFKNEAIIGELVGVLSDKKSAYGRYTGFYYLDPESKEFASYKVILSTITEGGAKSKTKYGLSGFSEVLKTLVPTKSYSSLFSKGAKITMQSVYDLLLGKGIVLEYFLNYFAAYNFARFLETQVLYNAVLINLGLDASVKSSMFKDTSYTNKVFREELFTVFNNSLITAQKSRLSYSNAVFINFSHNFKDPDLAAYISGEKKDVLDSYLSGDSKVFKDSGNFFIPKDSDKRYDVLRSALEVSSKNLVGNSIYGYDSDVDLYNTVVDKTSLRNLIVFKGPEPSKNLTKIGELYSNSSKNKFFNKLINYSVPDAIGQRKYSETSSEEIRKNLLKHSMTLEGKAVSPTYFLPNSTNASVAQSLICVTLSILSESKTFMSVLKDFADKSALYSFFSNSNNKNIRASFSKFLNSNYDLDESSFASFVKYSEGLATSINNIIPLFIAYMPNFSKDNFRYFDAGYWNNENCDFPYQSFYDTKGQKLSVSSDGKEFFTFIFKMFGIAQASYFSKITVHNEVYFTYHPGSLLKGNFDLFKSNNTFFKFVSELIYVHLRVLKNHYTGVSLGISESQICLKKVREFTYSKTSKKEFALIVSNDEKISSVASVFNSSFTESKESSSKTTDFSIVKINNTKFCDDSKNTDLFFVHMPETIVQGNDSKSENNNKVKSEALFNLINSNLSQNISQSFLLGDVNFNSPSDGKLSSAVYNKSFKKIKKFTPTSLGDTELDQIYYYNSDDFYCSYTNYSVHIDNRITKKGKMYSNHPITFVKSTKDDITDDKSKLLFGSYANGNVTSPKVLFYKK